MPDALREEAQRRRRLLEEAVAELHPVALEEFCARSTVSAATLAAALRDLTRTGDGVVVLCGSAYRNRGIEPLLDAVVGLSAVAAGRAARCAACRTARCRSGPPTRRRRSPRWCSR